MKSGSGGRDPVLWGILLVAGILRFLHIDGDLPYVLHFDEPTLVDNAVWMWVNHTLHPHFFNYPTGMIYLLAFLFGIVMAAGMLAGRFAGWDAAVAWLSSGTYPRPEGGGVLYFYPTIGVPALYVIGRSASAIAGVATVAIVHRLARAAGAGVATARFAAFLFAISPLAVEHAHFVTTDTAAGVLAAACLLATMGAERSAGSRAWIVAGAFAGLAAGFKYNAGFVAWGVVLCAAWRARRDGIGPAVRLCGASAAAAALAFLVTTPFALVDLPRFVHDVRYEALRVGTGAGSVAGIGETRGFARGFGFIGNGLSAAGVAALLWGAVTAIRSRSLPRILLVAVSLLGLVPLLTGTIVYARYLVPLWPALIVLTAIGMGDAVSRAGARMPALRRPVAAVLAVLLVGPWTVALARREAERARPDPRISMTVWAHANIPATERVAVEPGGIFPDPDHFTIDQVDFLGRHAPEFYRSRGIRWLLGSGRERLIAGREEYAEVAANHGAIAAAAERVWAEGGYAIYRLRGGESWEEEVESALAAGDRRGARDVLERAAEDGASALAWRRLAELRLADSDTTGGLAAYARASDLDSTDAETALALGVLRVGEGRYEDAVRSLLRAERHAPKQEPVVQYNLAVARLSLARARLEESRREEAQVQWSAALVHARSCVRYAGSDPNIGGIEDLVLRMGRRWGFAQPAGGNR